MSKEPAEGSKGKDRPGVVGTTIGPALRHLLGAAPDMSALRIDTLGNRPVMTAQQLVEGSSNLAEASNVARMLLGEKAYPRPAVKDQTHEQWLLEWYRRRQQLVHEDQVVGHRGMEDVSTTYGPIHLLNPLAICWHLQRDPENELYILAKENLDEQVAVLAAMSYEAPSRNLADIRLASAGVRTAQCWEQPSGPEFLLLATGLGGHPGNDARQLNPRHQGFSPLLWLGVEFARDLLQDAPGTAAARAFLQARSPDTAQALQTELDPIFFGCGSMHIRHYKGGQVLAHFPRGLMSPATGKWQKNGRRPWALGQPGQPLLAPVTPNGFVAWSGLTQILGGSTEFVCTEGWRDEAAQLEGGTPGWNEPQELPDPAEETFTFTIKHWSPSWRPAWLDALPPDLR